MSNHTAPSANATPATGLDDSSDRSRMSFGEHLEELRRCLIQALIGVALSTVGCLFFGREILEILCRPLFIVQRENGLQPQLQALAPMAGFTAYLKIAFLSGLILAMPWVLYKAWSFVATGLHAHEQRFVRSLLPASLGLFVVGVLFLYFIVLPIVLHFFIQFNQGFTVPDLTPTVFQTALLGEGDPAPASAESTKPGHVSIVAEDPVDPKPGDTWVNTVTRRLMIQTSEGPWSTAMHPGASASTKET